MSQMTIRRPFGELELSDQLGFQPHTVFHLFLGQSPLGCFFRQLRRAGGFSSRFLPQNFSALALFY